MMKHYTLEDFAMDYIKAYSFRLNADGIIMMSMYCSAYDLEFGEDGNFLNMWGNHEGHYWRHWRQLAFGFDDIAELLE